MLKIIQIPEASKPYSLRIDKTPRCWLYSRFIFVHTKSRRLIRPEQGRGLPFRGSYSYHLPALQVFPIMSELVFVTGASGFLGAHIVTQLLESGYRVRATARGPKVVGLRNSYASFGDRFEAVVVDDIATDQFPDALKGVDAVIHSASPLPGAGTQEGILKGAVEGTMNTVRQVLKAGIKRLVFTSSMATIMNPRGSFTDQDWNPITKEEALSGDSLSAYGASKTFAERELWKFGGEHPELDITTLAPPFLYGPLAASFSIPPTPNYTALSSDIQIYHLLSPTGVFPPVPFYADVRDMAKAHVLALRSPPTSSANRKRILFSSPYDLDFNAIVALIAEKRPELRDRLIKTTPPTFTFNSAPIDFDRIQQVLGMGISDFTPVENSILEAVDSILTVERLWIATGADISIPNA
ncbi:hypothetical protein BDZ94DRAFT_1260038 [Collybia nuda]|uniref:NAD-dependent epimerase/dehydratase domain-containing protein n=1 Tax=Collybia nuda TaxID=64659 RepID=A0A9P5Y6H6_9AGAR|nr:hypothetical protein BDZ94DRAFT_1260038 [Collybia nuda]